MHKYIKPKLLVSFNMLFFASVVGNILLHSLHQVTVIWFDWIKLFEFFDVLS